jgi:hypothetical protein
MLHPSSFWDLVEKFKNACKNKNWRIYGYEDIIYDGSEYHHLVMVRQTRLETFKRVITNPHQSIKRGDQHEVINVSYIAWISQEQIPKIAADFLANRPALLSRVALYDLSPLYKGKNICLKMNRTNSIVFREFENFLVENGFHFTPLE